MPTAGERPLIVHTEAWPGILRDSVAKVAAANEGFIRDQIQVRELCRWAAKIDRSGNLGGLFDTPPDLSPEQLHECVGEEGWILGAHGWNESQRIELAG
jgi:hypothetical protein